MKNVYEYKIDKIRNKICSITNKYVKIIAVTKNQNCDQIKQLKNINIDGYGENKVQDIINKKCFFNHDLHFIGHLQTNKIKKLINNNVELIQSIDSIKIVNIISKYCKQINKIQNILIQIKFENDLHNFGININNLEKFILECSNIKFIKIKGLMVMPSNKVNEKNKFSIYEQMYKVFIDINQKKYNNTSMDILSMGTSHDYHIAVACGSNMIRIGTEIFN